MDALVKAALEKVTGQVETIDQYTTATGRKAKIARAINAVDALKSALKAL